LSLLTLKPGLFTANGRDRAGQVWFDDLGTTAHRRIGAPMLVAGRRPGLRKRRRQASAHASHKGSFGDVAVLGGESTAHSHMAGAALLAARAALHAGAGRVLWRCSAAPPWPWTRCNPN
jgi:NAD(P)H-hydrate repair Nnr-like enzyme with NAD(P)H-hydrate dehydratase domain